MDMIRAELADYQICHASLKLLVRACQSKDFIILLIVVVNIFTLFVTF